MQVLRFHSSAHHTHYVRTDWQAEKSKPLFLLMKGGQEVARVSGAIAVELQSAIQKNVTRKSE